MLLGTMLHTRLRSSESWWWQLLAKLPAELAERACLTGAPLEAKECAVAP